ncbi:DDE transposase [Flavobacterium branchiophilum]|uniref:Transposase-like zinc ribbon protein n=1 Tax=Flavobacterium branchiophilum TaxID=55197 RepID=A0A543G2E7_9FLAO|nr:IS1595 family transposase [Flavobacterium branchiophilum]OXA79237.1 DDE transposase [Flavobacterium branchiophilum] [Flavobacterium branchiophilum NBRC 15030 = ATCC 35035]TQM40273.1 transposase-like zinc ribbon protein [Flavobacterium branchiophilum]GEM53970.1 DDE transposase [Flavobacterium branchiophilum NBRC 15030 = ATCC 35035]
MNILDFYKVYPDEESCKNKFKEIRDKEGVVCRKCNNSTHYWKQDRDQYECKKCRNRITLRSGTVMENSKLSYQYWFIAMHLLTCTKKSFSAKEMQRQLGHKRYEPIWAMMHKIRSVMGLRDDQHKLTNAIELDEGFFETVNINFSKEDNLKRGRGSERQTKVLVMIESEENSKNENKHRPSKKAGYLKMKVITNLKTETINKKIEKFVEPKTKVTTDDSTSYNKISATIEHFGEKVNKKEINKILPWVHKAISNSKRLLLDIHHRIDADFLQNYLNEFCYKFNRRHFNNPMERLLIAGVNHRWNEL